MARTVGIGHQDFEKLRTRNLFYVDKTSFIRVQLINVNRKMKNILS